MVSEPVTLDLTVSPGSEEYKLAKLVDLIGRLPGVADVEETDTVRCVECGKDLSDPKNCGDPDVGGAWVCADDDCRIMHEPEMRANRRVIRS